MTQPLGNYSFAHDSSSNFFIVVSKFNKSGYGLRIPILRVKAPFRLVGQSRVQGK